MKCDKFFLMELYDLQDQLIEHKLPNYDGNVSYFTEAAGDIYRELCSKIVSHSYIFEKLYKLRNFYDLSTRDIKELLETSKRHPDWFEQLDNFIIKINKLKEITKGFNFGKYDDRKNKMLKALDISIDICLFAKSDLSIDTVKEHIKEFDDMFNIGMTYDEYNQKLL